MKNLEGSNNSNNNVTVFKNNYDDKKSPAFIKLSAHYFIWNTQDLSVQISSEPLPPISA